MRHCEAALAAILVTGGPAFAQHPMVLDKLAQINARAPQPALADLQGAAAVTARAYGAANKACVPKSIELSDVAPITGARDVLQGVLAGKLRNGWSGFANHVGCVDAPVVHYMFVQQADGSLAANIVNEGRTLANPVLIRDTSAAAALAALQLARKSDAKCDGAAMKMGPTRVVSRSADLGPEYYGARYAGSWTEAWEFRTCGRAFSVPVEFRPDGDGGAYTRVKAEAVALLP